MQGMTRSTITMTTGGTIEGVLHFTHEVLVTVTLFVCTSFSPAGLYLEIIIVIPNVVIS